MGRRTLFGRELPEAVLRIVQISLSVSAAIEGADVDHRKRDFSCTILINQRTKNRATAKLIGSVLIIF